MEDYKKKYERALERAKEELGSGCFNKGSIEYIFPELKESEDEKSKKWILEYLHDGLRKSDEQFKDQFKAAIAWLEKQVSPQMIADAYLRGCNDTEKKWLESKRYTKMDVDNAYLEGIANAKNELEKQGEMDIEMDIEKPITIGKRMAVSGKLKELIDNKDPKSIEETKEKMLAETSKWTEEDERLLTGIYYILEGIAPLSYEKEVEWLKSIKTRLQ